MDLHDHRHEVLGGQFGIGLRPAAVRDRRRLAKQLPHLLRHVGGDERERLGNEHHCFTHCWISGARPGVDGLARGVHQLHRACHDDVVAPVLDELGDLRDRLVRALAQPLVTIGEVDPALARDVGGDPVRTLQELQCAAGRHDGPIDVVFRRASEDHRQADRVDTVFVDLLAKIDAIAERLAHGLAAIENLPLIEQFLHRLVEIDHAEVVEHLREEPHVEQVQDGVLNAAHVLRHGHPAVDGFGIERALGVVRRAVAVEVPRGVDEGVHRIGVTLGRGATLGTCHVDPLGCGRERRGALRRQLFTAHVRELDGELIVGDRDFPTLVTVDDRDRAAPEALAREQPIAQAVLDGAGACAVCLELLDHLRDASGLVCEAVEHLGVLVGAIACGGDARLGRVGAVDIDDRANREVELLGEVEVALVVGRDSHDGAGAVIREHVVCGPDRDLLACDGVRRVRAQEDAGLLALGGLTLDLAGVLDLLDVGLELRSLVVTDELCSQIAIGRDDHVGGAVERVRAGGEDGDRLVAAFDRELDVCTLAAPDPVALHREHVLGPAAFELLHVVQQAVGIVGDLEVPLVELALGDFRLATLALAVDDLLVGEHRLVLGAPVDEGVLAVGKPTFEEAQEQPLGPAVVLLVRGVEPPGPVEAEAVALERRHLGLDVGVRPFRRMRVVLDGSVLGWQAEGVPSDRVQDVVALEAQIARQHITHRVGLCVPHVEIARRVGEHVEHVATLAGSVVERLVGLVLFPERLPLLLRGYPIIVLSTHAFSFSLTVGQYTPSARVSPPGDQVRKADTSAEVGG